MRHATGIQLKNITLQYKKQDFRPAMVVDDVQQLQVQGLQVPTTQPAPVIVLKDVPAPAMTALKLPFDNSKAVMVVK
jgi:hypothetical protein